METNRVYLNIEDRKKKKVNIVQTIAWDSDETWGATKKRPERLVNAIKCNE